MEIPLAQDGTGRFDRTEPLEFQHSRQPPWAPGWIFEQHQGQGLGLPQRLHHRQVAAEILCLHGIDRNARDGCWQPSALFTAHSSAKRSSPSRARTLAVAVACGYPTCQCPSSRSSTPVTWSCRRLRNSLAISSGRPLGMNWRIGVTVIRSASWDGSASASCGRTSLQITSAANRQLLQGSGTARSRQILRTSRSLISVWRGMALRRFMPG